MLAQAERPRYLQDSQGKVVGKCFLDDVVQILVRAKNSQDQTTRQYKSLIV